MLILTKPLGTGIISTVLKADKADERILKESTDSMLRLNRTASRIMAQVGVNACTDITGFGLLGHLYELINASKVGTVVYSKKVPKFEGVYKYIEMGIVPSGTYTNMEFIEPYVRFSKEIKESGRILLSDAQTSGGLLISVSRGKDRELLRKLKEESEPAWVIGDVTDRDIIEVVAKV